MRAAFIPEAAGHRHIIVSEKKWFAIHRAAEILKEFESKGYKITENIEMKEDPNNSSDNTRMTKVLGITPIGFTYNIEFKIIF